MTSRVLQAVAGVAILVSVIGCAENGLRTFNVIQIQAGVPVACEAFGLVDPVRGTLRGDAGGSEPIWLESADGRRLSIVWPKGFAVRFEPTSRAVQREGGTACIGW